MPEKQAIRTILAVAAIIIVLGIAVDVSAALNPQPEPPKIYKIGINSGKGLFSGEIGSPYLRPQPEPPIFNLGKNASGEIFSGLIVPIT